MSRLGHQPPASVRLLKRALARWRSSLLRLNVVWVVDALTARVALLVPLRNEERFTIVVATAGMGNTGDEAMLESCLANIPGPITVVVQTRQSFSVDRSGVDVEVIPSLLDASLNRRAGGVFRFVRRLRSASNLCVIGADVMDGVYYAPSAVARFSLIAIANRMGVDARVLGFSWSDRAEPSAVEALKRVSAATKLYVRDPVSLRRLQGLEVRSLRSAADVVFALPGHRNRPVLPNRATRSVALVNVSGLIQERMDQVPEFVEVIAALNGRGMSVVVVPHVVRQGDDDLAAQQLLKESLPAGADVVFLEAKPSIGQVQELVASAGVIVTGRMHLAIFGLAATVPALILGTQGKVSGLCELVGAGAVEVTPRPGFGKDVVAHFDQMLGQGALPVERALRAALPTVVALAATNFEGLSP